jgi:hypothetical protein
MSNSVNQPKNDTVEDTPRPVSITLAVYRDLRIGLAVTAVMLAASIIADRLQTRCWQAALSEYFFNSAHRVFIAALLGLATLFFVYRASSDTEDALLTLAGVAALVAALVPQGRPKKCVPLFLPADYQIEQVIRLNMAAVVVALVLGWALTMWQHRYNKTRQRRSVGGTIALYLLRLVVAVALIVLFWKPDAFKVYAHGAAGVLLLSAFIATVFVSASLARRETPSPDRRNYARFYKWIAWSMVATLIAVVAAHIWRPELFGVVWVTVLESAVTLEFCVYWVVQTIDLWDSPERSERLSDADRELLAHRSTKNGIAGLKSEVQDVMNAPAGQKLMTFL